ncbi:MAG: efflux RND transporter periplasmic adaptor subunit [Bacteroidales bacterium]
MRLTKVIILFSLIIATTFTPSCNDFSSEKTPEAIRDSISEYRNQISGLNMKISRLETQLTDMGERLPTREATKVRADTLQTRDFEHYIKINGSVEAVRDATISPELNGQMKKIMVSRGDRVNAGQVVAELNTSVIENNIEEVKTNLQMAETVYERQKRLWEQEIGSEMQYLEARNRYESLQSSLKSMESQLDLAILRAPFSGIIDDIFIKEGELAMPGSPVMRLINLTNLYINTDVSERYLPLINSNDSVILQFPIFPDYEDNVPVYLLGNVINPENRSFRLQLRIVNPEEKFKPNMVATLGIKTFSEEDVIVIPSILIKEDVQGHFVFIAKQDSGGHYVAEKTYIERGPESEGKTLVEEGIGSGDLIITEGHNKVGDGDMIQLINI